MKTNIIMCKGVDKKMKKEHWVVDANTTMDEKSKNAVNEYKRDMAIFLLILSLGLKLSELKKLDIEDIDIDNRTVKIMDNGKMIRKIGLSRESAIALNIYLASRYN